MKPKILCIAVSLTFSCSSLGFSQSNPQWMHFTNTDGVSGIAIRGTELWAATSGGVVRYNMSTQQKTIYTRIDGLGSNFVTAISVAPNGRPWCTTYAQYGINAGLYEFDGARWVQRSGSLSIFGNIAHDRAGNLWMAADLNRRGFVYTNSGQLQQLTLNGYANCVAVDKLDRPWFGMWNNGAYVKNGTQWTHYDTLNSGLASNLVGAMTVDNQNRVWFAHPYGGLELPEKGISMFDGATWVRFNTSNSGLPSNAVYQLVADSLGNIYALCAAACAQRVVRFDGTQWQPVNGADTTQFSWENGAVAADNIGNVYFGTKPIITLINGSPLYKGGGIIRRYNSVGGWTQHLISSSTMYVWGVWTMAADSSGSIWFGSLFAPPKQLVAGRWIVHDTTLFPSRTPAGIATEPNGTTWLVGGNWGVGSSCPPSGGFQGGVASFDGTRWRVFGTHNSGLPSNSVTCVLTDASGTKWFGTYDRGVTRFDNTTWTTYDTTNSGLRNNWVQKIAQDRNGRIWFMTNGGMCSYSGGQWRTERISAVDICRDYQSNLWFIVRSRPDSLFKWDGSTMLGFPLPSGFGNLSVSSITVAPDRKVWIGVGDDYLGQGRGVWSFDGTNWTTYSFANSLLPYPSIGAVFADPRGNKWFASSQPQGGLAVYNENGVTLVGVEEKQFLPASYSLLQNYPNPFNPTTRISYSLPKTSRTIVRVYDILGKEVKILLDEIQEAGPHVIDFDANGLSSGVYFYQLRSGSYTETKKMILLR